MQGFASETVTSAVDFAFQKLKLHRVAAEERSIKNQRPRIRMKISEA